MEQLSHRHSKHENTLPIVTDAVTTRRLEKTSPCNNTVRERGKPAFNMNEDYLKTSHAVTEVFPVAGKVSFPYEVNTQSVSFCEDSNTRNGSLECLDWFSVGVLAEKSPDKLNLQLCSGKGLTAGNNTREGQITEGFNYESVLNPTIKTMKNAAGGKFESLDIDEDKKRFQETASDTGKTAGKSSLEMFLEGTDIQKQKVDCLIPRKRPRKSLPRKIDIKNEQFGSGSHSTDSEETLSADEIASELSSNKGTPVVSPKSSSSDSISPRGTKVIFRRTAGTVSPKSPSIIITIIITLFKSQIILAEHECSTNWGDCKSIKSNQINQTNQINQIKC